MPRRIERFKCRNCGKVNQIKIVEENHYDQIYPYYNAATLDFDQPNNLYMKCEKCSYSNINLEEYSHTIDDILESKSYKKPLDGVCKNDEIATDLVRVAMLLSASGCSLNAAKFYEYAFNKLKDIENEEILNSLHLKAILELQTYISWKKNIAPSVALMYINILRMMGWNDIAYEFILSHFAQLNGLDLQLVNLLMSMMEKNNRQNLSFHEMLLFDLK